MSKFKVVLVARCGYGGVPDSEQDWEEFDDEEGANLLANAPDNDTCIDATNAACEMHHVEWWFEVRPIEA